MVRVRGLVSAFTACAVAAVGLLGACGRAASKPTAQPPYGPESPTLPLLYSPEWPASQPLCGLELPESTSWRQVWRTDYEAGGIRDMVRDGDWLWLATPSDVVRLNLDTHECTRFSQTDGDPELPLSDVHALLLDPEGRVWAVGSHGLARYNGQQWQVIPTAVRGVSLALDRVGNLWVMGWVEGSTSPYIVPLRYLGHEPPEDGLWEAEKDWTLLPGTGGCEPWAAVSNQRPEPRFGSPEECRLLAAWRDRLASLTLPEGVVMEDTSLIAAETSDRLWVLTRRWPDRFRSLYVLLAFDGEGWNVLPWPYGYTCCLVADETRGGVWVGTGEGLVFSDGRGFRKFMFAPGDLLPLGPGVPDLVVDGGGRLWAATEWELLRYDEASDAWQPTEIGEAVFLSPDDRGGLWVVPPYRQPWFSHFDGERWSHYTFPAGWPCMPTDILADVGGGLWLSSIDCALRGFDGATWDEYDAGPLGGGELIRGVGRDIYLATWDGVIRHYDGATWETLPPADPSRDAQILALVVNQKGEVWAAFSAQPFLLVYRDGQWMEIAGLSDEPVTALLLDARGDLWAGTGWGLLHYDGRTWERIVSTLPRTYITVLAEDRQGRMWVGGQYGLSVYDPHLGH